MHSQFESPDSRNNQPPSRGAEPLRPQRDAQRQRPPSGLEGLSGPTVVRGKPPVIAFRANGIYEVVLEQVRQELATLSTPLAVDLFIAPKITPRQEVKRLYDQFVLERGHLVDLLVYDRTTQAALKDVLPNPHQLNLDDIFGQAVRTALLRKHGEMFFLSPDECEGTTADERGQRFIAQLKHFLPKLLGIAFRRPNPMPDQVFIFTEELSSHVPFWYVEQLGKNSGELIRASLVRSGVPASRITVVKNPDEILFNHDRSKDPFVDMIRARYVALIGDRHVLAPRWFQNGIINGLSQTPFEHLSVFRDTQSGRGRRSTKLPAQPADIDIQDGIIHALKRTLKPFGEDACAKKIHRNGRQRQAAFLRFPLENLLGDFASRGLISPKHAVTPQDLVPVVTRELLELLRAKQKKSV